jgi:hypothetical protein
VPKAPVIREGFKGVRRRVAEIQYAAGARVCALSILALIITDDCRFERNLRGDKLFQPCGRLQLHARPFFFEKFVSQSKELEVTDGSLLDAFAEACGQLSTGKSQERFRINHHDARLMKSADHVFAERRIDGRLAADGRIYLRKKRGRYLNERNST